MTHAIALTGQWEGLRAFPRANRAPDHRKRLESGLDRLGGLYEQMAARAAMLQAGMERLNSLRASLIDELDATDTDADLEADGCDEPSLCGIGCNCVIGGADDLEDQCEDEGADESDEGVDDRGEPDCDDEPDHESCAWPDEGDQTSLPVTKVYLKLNKPPAHPLAATLAARPNRTLKNSAAPVVYLIGPGLPHLSAARL